MCGFFESGAGAARCVPGAPGAGPGAAAPPGAAAAAWRHSRDVAPGAAGTAPAERRPAPAECPPGGLPGVCGAALRVRSAARLCRPFPRGAPEKRAARAANRANRAVRGEVLQDTCGWWVPIPAEDPSQSLRRSGFCC